MKIGEISQEVQKLQEQLKDVLTALKSGGPVKEKLQKIEETVTNLSNDPNIPQGIKDKLQKAQKILQDCQKGSANFTDLAQLKQTFQEIFKGLSK